MTIKNISIWMLAGVFALGGAAFAQNHTVSNGQVGISGATLFRECFVSLSLTNDHKDVDGDTVSGFTAPDVVDQLAADWTDFSLTPPTYGDDHASGESYFYVNYRGTSSGSGLGELLNYHDSGTSPSATPSDHSYINRTRFYNSETKQYENGGSVSVIANARVDIAIMDVPTPWMVQASTSASAGPGARPNPGTSDASYGYCPTTSWNAGQSQQLKSLTVGSTTFNTNTSSPDSNTIFDTQIAYVPVSYISNAGVLSIDRDVTEDDGNDFAAGTLTRNRSDQGDGYLVGFQKTELQTLFTTGRMDTGENLVAATRNAGSGTRNAAMNALEIDPSWGRGDNLGVEESDSSKTDLDQDFNCNFMTSSSRMQEAVSRSRLAVGYQGLTTAESKMSKVVEHAAVMNDLASEGGTKYSYFYCNKGTENNLVNNGDVNDGWRAGGNETMVTVGDPEATSGDSQMSGAEKPAADFINNLTYSISQFGQPGGGSTEENYYMPGEYIALNYSAAAALEYAPKGSHANWIDQRSGSGDGTQNTSLADTIVDNQEQPTVFLENGLRAPVRGSQYTYDDGASSTTGYLYYTDEAGSKATLGGGAVMNERNLVQADFNADKKRDINDIADMMDCITYTDTDEDLDNGILAWAYREGDGVMPHIIGDFNNDGNFDKEDVRYFADGLAYDSTKTVGSRTGLINRVDAFEDVDDEFGGNFFETQIKGADVDPGDWTNGDSMFDVAGSDESADLYGATPGAAPNGSDKDIDAYDLSYVVKVVRQGLPGTPGDQNSDNRLSWFNGDGTVNLEEAISMDLSVDFDGDFDNDSADIQAMFDLLETGWGDANLDGEVDILDLNAVGNNWASGTYWGTGDMNGDGAVDILDLNSVGNNWSNDYDGTGAPAPTPEPATMGLLAVGGLVLLRRRK